MIGLARQHLPVQRLGLLPTPALMQLQRLLDILVEAQRRLSASSSTRRSSLISVDGNLPCLSACRT
jgi:hypothetical protein